MGPVPRSIFLEQSSNIYITLPESGSQVKPLKSPSLGSGYILLVITCAFKDALPHNLSIHAFPDLQTLLLGEASYTKAWDTGCERITACIPFAHPVSLIPLVPPKHPPSPPPHHTRYPHIASSPLPCWLRFVPTCLHCCHNTLLLLWLQTPKRC